MGGDWRSGPREVTGGRSPPRGDRGGYGRDRDGGDRDGGRRGFGGGGYEAPRDRGFGGDRGGDRGRWLHTPHSPSLIFPRNVVHTRYLVNVDSWVWVGEPLARWLTDIGPQ